MSSKELAGLTETVSRMEEQLVRNLGDIKRLKGRVETLEGHVDFYLLGDPSKKESMKPLQKDTSKPLQKIDDDRVNITVVGNMEVAKVKKFIENREEFMELSEKLAQQGFTYFKEPYWKDSRWERPLQR